MLLRMYGGHHYGPQPVVMPPPLPRRKGPSKAFIVLLVVGIGLFTTVLTVVLVIVLWPKGEKVGEQKILPAGAPVMTDAKPGDELAFRLDYVVQGAPHEIRKRRKTVLNNYLAATTLTVTAKHESGAEQTASCHVDGNATMSSSSPSQESRTGVGVDCTIVLARPGKHSVGGVIAWDKNIEPLSATLEVRRVSAK